MESQYQGNYDDAINKLKSAQIGNMGADLVQIYDIGTRFMIDSGWVVPMQHLIDGDGWDVSLVEPNIAAYYTVDNSLYRMPFNSSTPILYYNKDMSAKAGITEIPQSFSDLETIGQDLMTKGGAGEVISLSVYGWFFEQFTCKQGKHYVNNGNGIIDAATAYFPKVSNDVNGGVSIGGGSLWALNNEDEGKQKATWEFVKFLVSAESQAYWNAQTGYFPVTTAAHNEPVFKENIAKYP